MNKKTASKIAEEIWNEGQFSTFRSTRVDFDLIIARDRAANIPDFYQGSGIKDYRSYEAQYAADIISQEMGTANPAYNIHSRSLQSERRQGAQNFEDFMNRWWTVSNDTDLPPYDQTCGDQIRRGVGVYRLGLRSYPLDKEGDTKWTIWADRPALDGQDPKEYLKEVEGYKIRSPTPFVLEAVDVMTCAWGRDADGVAYWVEKSARPINQVLEAYKLSQEGGKITGLGPAAPQHTSSIGKTVEFTELCTRGRIYCWVKQTGSNNEDFPLGEWENPFGAVRYIIVPGRIGKGPGVDTLYRPMIESSLEIAILDTDFGTLRKFAGYRAGYTIDDLVVKDTNTPYINPESQKATIYIHPMKPYEYQLPAGTELKPRQSTGVDLDKVMEYIDSLKARYGVKDVLAGGSQGEREPAWGLALRGESAQKSITPGINGQKVALKQLARLVAYCVKNWIKEDVLIWANVADDLGRQVRKQVKVGPDDIEEDFDIDVNMGYRSRAIQMAEREAMRRAKVEGDISRLRYQEDGWGLDNPAQEDAIIEIEKMDRATDAMVMWEVIEAAIASAAAEVGAAPPTPEKILALRSAVFGIAMPQQAEERRPAGPVRSSAEAPPTPAAQRAV